MDEQCFGDPHHRRKIINGICRKLLVLQSKNVAPRLYFAGIECQSSTRGLDFYCVWVYMLLDCLHYAFIEMLHSSLDRRGQEEFVCGFGGRIGIVCRVWFPP